MPAGSAPTVSSCHESEPEVHFAATVTTPPTDQAVTSPHWLDATVTGSVRDTESYAASSIAPE